MPPGPEAPRVLIVDDEPDVRHSIALLLSSEIPQLEVHEAADPEAAIDFLSREHVDILIVDYRMPKMNGLELLEKVHPAHPNTVPILITAFPSLDLALEAVNHAHVRFFMTKPFREADMIQRIHEALAEQAHVE